MLQIMNLVEGFSEILTFSEMWVFLGFVLIGFLIGIMVGWTWKPTWVSFGDCTFDGPAVQNQMVESNCNPDQQPVQVGTDLDYGSSGVDRKMDNPSSSSSVIKKEENHLVKDEDLKHLWHLVEKRDKGPVWKHTMDRSTSTMTYQAWQRDPQTGPPQYCSITIYEDTTPELLRDFFWDDDLRLKWDDMLLHATTLEEFPAIGASVVHWIRRFPFFCSDREYIIGRRIWELESSFYCVTKGVSCPSVPRKQKPRRVDVYYSSWFIHSVKSKKGNNQPSCEVIFFHHEDMGIPWEIAKFGIKQGMWKTAKKIEQAFHWYQNERTRLTTISHHVFMAQMSTKIDETYLTRLEFNEHEEMGQTEPMVVVKKEKQEWVNMSRVLIVGGVVILACSVDCGLLTKTAIFGVARRFGNIRSRFRKTTRL